MQIIRHRVNTLDELKNLPPHWGAEMDLRSESGRLIVQHEPHTTGVGFTEYLKAWLAVRRTGSLIVNPKEDGLEKEAARLLSEVEISNYFFLDLSLPTTVRLTVKEGEGRVAVRVSEYETIESAMKLAGKAKWVWVDCFHGKPPSETTVQSLKSRFSVCLVSPELQGYPKESISAFHPLAPLVDSVCTKYPECWP